LIFYGFGCFLDGFGVGDVGGKNEGATACGFNLRLGGIESVDAAGEKSDLSSMRSKLARDGAAQSGRSAGNDYRFISHHFAIQFPFFDLLLGSSMEGAQSIGSSLHRVRWDGPRDLSTTAFRLILRSTKPLPALQVDRRREFDSWSLTISC
jgi:hypothetical protein